MGSYTGTKVEQQACRDKKLIGDAGSDAAKYAYDRSGKPTFVWAEACDNAGGPPRHLRRKRTRWSNPKIATNCNLVLADIQRLIERMFEGPCDTDDGALFYEQAVPFLVARHIAYGRSEETLNTMEWAWKFTPKLVADNPRAWFDAAEQRILAAFDNHDRPSIPDRDSVSKALSITQARRDRFELLHLPAIERPHAVRHVERLAKKAGYNRDARRKAGATPRQESISAREPWKAYGISRATYYRRVEAGTLPPDPVMRPVLAMIDADGRDVLRLVS